MAPVLVKKEGLECTTELWDRQVTIPEMGRKFVPEPRPSSLERAIAEVSPSASYHA